jgi:hypothetical protein
MRRAIVRFVHGAADAMGDLTAAGLGEFGLFF